MVGGRGYGSIEFGRGQRKQGSLAPPLSPDFAAMPDRTGHDERSRRERIAAGLSAVSQKWMSMCLPAFLLGPGIRQRACLRAVQGQSCHPGGWQRLLRLRRPNLARCLEELRPSSLLGKIAFPAPPCSRE